MTEIGMIDSYKKQSINIVPIPKGSGKALNIEGGWKRYQYEMFTGAIPEDQDIAVILGKISGNLLVLDFDECDDLKEIEKVKDDILNYTLVVRTGDGYHVYIKVDKLPVKANTFLTKGRYKMEVKGEGAYVVGATSKHYDKDENGKYVLTGKNYKVISNTTTVGKIEATGDQIISQLVKGLDWIPQTQLAGNGAENIVTPTTQLASGKWQHGERYNNGFKLALRRFHQLWNYEDVTNEAHTINNGCNPPHSVTEVDRWVNDAHDQYKKNINNPDQQFFKPFDPALAGEASKQNDKDKIDNTALKIQGQYFFRNTRDTDELYVFDGKIYVQDNAASIIAEETEKEIPNCTTHDAAEVINKIKRTNYIARDEIDSNPSTNVVENCILNMKTLETREHNPNHISTVLLPVAYHKVELDEITVESIKDYLEGTLFLQYLESCFTINGKLEKKSFMTVLEIMASTLLKRQLDKAVMFIGKGANGKSIMLDYIQSMLGNENVSHIPIHDIENDRFIKAELFGKMANVFADIESHELKKTGTLKVIISGDSITAQKKHKNPFSFKPFVKLLFSANRFPYVHDQTDGFFRRWIIVEWKRQFERTPENANLRQNLLENREEMSKVFSLLVLLAKKLDETGKFTDATSTNSLREEWNKHSDPVMQFIDECIIEVEGRMCTKTETYKAYKEFCYKHEIQPLSINKFGMIFGEYYEKGQEKTDGINRKTWLDIQIKVPEVQSALKEFQE